MRIALSSIIALALSTIACVDPVVDGENSGDGDGDAELAGDGDGDDGEGFCCDCSIMGIDWCAPSNEADCTSQCPEGDEWCDKKWCEKKGDCSAQCDLEPFDVCCTCHPTDGFFCDPSLPTTQCLEVGLEVVEGCVYDSDFNVVCPDLCEQSGDGDGDE